MCLGSFQPLLGWVGEELCPPRCGAGWTICSAAGRGKTWLSFAKHTEKSCIIISLVLTVTALSYMSKELLGAHPSKTLWLVQAPLSAGLTQQAHCASENLIFNLSALIFTGLLTEGGRRKASLLCAGVTY